MIQLAHPPSVLVYFAVAVRSFYRQNVWGLTLTAAWSLAAGVILYFGWFQPPWLSYSRLPWAPKQQEYVAGEPAVIQIWRCNSSNDPEGEDYFLSHVLTKLDGPFTEQCPRRIVLAPGLVHIEKGVCGFPEESAANVIPSTTCPGRYKVQGVASVQLAWRVAKVPWESSEFIVKAKEAP